MIYLLYIQMDTDFVSITLPSFKKKILPYPSLMVNVSLMDLFWFSISPIYYICALLFFHAKN